MFTLPEPIVITAVQHYESDEVHITGKSSGKPMAVLSFVAADTTGNRVPNAPIATVKLTGTAYNEFYAAWNSEQTLYATLLKLWRDGTPGVEVTGVDISKVADALAVTAYAPEVMAVPRPEPEAPTA